MIDKLIDEAIEKGLTVEEEKLPGKLKGLLIADRIYLDNSLSKAKKIVALREEIEHHKYTVGNIIDIRNIRNKKQELLARWATYEKLLTFDMIIRAVESGVANVYEFSEFVDLPEDFIIEAINYYRQRYVAVELGQYFIDFDGPLRVLKLF